MGTHLPGERRQPWDSSGFASDGTLKPEYAARMKRVLDALDANGMVAFVTLFYQGQDQRIANEAGVIRAVDQATDFILANAYTNVVVEIANEAGHPGFNHAILSPSRIGELIDRVQARGLLAGTSLGGGVLPSTELANTSDLVLLHGNGQSPDSIRSMVQTMRSRTSKPIVFNEDSTSIANMDAATAAGSSWGYYDQGTNNYRDGFQSPPINWTINTSSKQAFFDHVYQNSRRPAGPVVTSAQFNYKTGHSFTAAFSTNVGPSISSSDLVVKNLNDNTTVASSKIAVSYNATTYTATFTFPGFAGGLLPEANYSATISGAGWLTQITRLWLQIR